MSSGAPQSGQKAVRGRKKTHTAHEASGSRKGRRRRKSEPEAESLTRQPLYFCVRVRNAKAQAIARRTRPLSAETVPDGRGAAPEDLIRAGGKRICAASGKHRSITGRSAERSLTCPALWSRFVIVLRSFSGRRCGMPFCIYLIIGYKTIFFVISEEKMRSA